MPGNIEKYNRAYREIREEIRHMYGDSPPFNPDIVARVLAKYLDEIREKGIDIREIINTIADAWDSSLSRPELIGLVEDAVRAFLGPEPHELSERDMLLMELSSIEHDIDEIEELIEEAANDEVKQQLEIQRAQLMREAEEIRKKLRRLEAKSRPRPRKTRRKKPRIEEKVVVHEKYKPEEARPARRKTRPAPSPPPRKKIDVLETRGLIRYLLNIELPKAIDTYHRLEDEIEKLDISKTIYNLKKENTYMALLLGEKKVLEKFSELNNIEDIVREIESEIKWYEKEKRRGRSRHLRARIDYAHSLGELMGYLKYLINRKAVEDELKRIGELISSGKYADAAARFKKLVETYNIPVELYGSLEEVARKAMEAIRGGVVNPATLSPILRYVEERGIQLGGYPPSVMAVLSRIHVKNPCSRAQLYMELYRRATDTFKKYVGLLCKAIDQGRILDQATISKVIESVSSLPEWEADMLEAIIREYEEMAEQAREIGRVEARRVEESGGRERGGGIPAILPEPRIVSRRFEVDDKIVIENDLDEDTYHILCMIMGLPEEIFVYQPPSVKYSKYCPIQYYIRRDIARGVFHTWFPVYGPRIIDWARRIVQIIDDAIVTGRLDANLWLKHRCEKFAAGQLGW